MLRLHELFVSLGLCVLRLDLCIAVGYRVSAARLKHSKQSGTKVTPHFKFNTAALSKVVSFPGRLFFLDLPGYQHMRSSILTVRNKDCVCCGGYQFEQF
jgi:hypothetical protein